MDFPFEEKKVGKKIFLREFKESIDSDELIWHLDRDDRKIFILESNGWKLQMDNELPKELVRGDTHFIPKMTYHRVIKGTGDLKIRLTKLEEK